MPVDVCLLAVADRAWTHRKRQRRSLMYGEKVAD